METQTISFAMYPRIRVNGIFAATCDRSVDIASRQTQQDRRRDAAIDNLLFGLAAPSVMTHSFLDVIGRDSTITDPVPRTVYAMSTFFAVIVLRQRGTGSVHSIRCAAQRNTSASRQQRAPPVCAPHGRRRARLRGTVRRCCCHGDFGHGVQVVPRQM